jgi:type 2 lantibiotic biosynthesis protein LanM
VTSRHLDTSLGCLISPALDELATQLVFISGLSTPERAVIIGALRKSLDEILYWHVSRLLVLELNAARVTGRLNGRNSEERWQHFLDLSSRRSFWDELAIHYPTLLSRIGAIVRNRSTATVCFAKRWASERPRLASLCGTDPGELQELRFGAGDSHGGGFTVALLVCEGGRLVYKPRSVAVDIALRNFLAELQAEHGRELSIRVPSALDFGEHGWVEFIVHRYAAGSDELAKFYRGIGHWLAIMRLVGGSDLYAENLIAQGASPVVVDCETLFTPKIPPSPSGYGGALDRAVELVTNTVLTVGLLPARGAALGWRGVDISAVGMLPGQQPMHGQQGILHSGTDQARIETILVERPPSQNHPSSQPALGEHWPEVLRGFDELTATVQRLDGTGALRSRLQAFEDCRIRVVLRATEVYAELARMLWHPVSLHNQEEARQRAFELLHKMAENAPIAPSDPDVIKAEIEDLLEGDIPHFVTIVREGRLHGPRGTGWLPQRHLAEAALDNWRAADFNLERNVIQSSLASAYINDGWMRDRVSLLPKRGRGGDLDVRRRQQAAEIVHRVMSTAIYGDDGSVAWIGPVLGAAGWSVQPLQQDLYNGLSGIALLAGAYLHEATSDHANPMEGVDNLLAAALHTLHLMEEKRESLRQEGLKLRPLPPGGYLGLGSQIWTYLVLCQWGLDGGDGLQRASKLAEEISAAAAADEINDLVSGTAGAIAPLLMLAGRTGDKRYVQMASQLGDLLGERAKHRNGQAYWTHNWSPEGLGGFAHGVTGIAWALTLLARATGNARYEELAQQAFAFEDALFDEEEENWRDLRTLEGGAKTATAWCHGSVGIGLAHLNLDPMLAQESTRRYVRRAATATWQQGMGAHHCACHGDLGAWELLGRAIAVGEAPKGLGASYLFDLILTSLEQHAPSRGLGRNTFFAPGLLPGMGGVAYQLLRAHPESDLRSILVPSEEE